VDDNLDRAYHLSMPYQFWEWEKELEPQASSARSGGPPRKITGIGVLDPPGPPKRPPGPLAALPASFLIRLLAGLILAALAISIFFLAFFR
jgi:hypothetical protein